MSAKKTGIHFEIEFTDQQILQVYLPLKEGRVFKFANDVTNGPAGGFIPYELAHYLNPVKYPNFDPEKDWLHLSQYEKDLVRQGEIDARKIISKITSIFLKAADDARATDGKSFINTFRPFPFYRYDDPTLMFEIIHVHEDVKIIKFYSA